MKYCKDDRYAIILTFQPSLLARW